MDSKKKKVLKNDPKVKEKQIDVTEESMNVDSSEERPGVGIEIFGQPPED